VSKGDNQEIYGESGPCLYLRIKLWICGRYYWHLISFGKSWKLKNLTISQKK
jgi:hypothetical protein